MLGQVSGLQLPLPAFLGFYTTPEFLFLISAFLHWFVHGFKCQNRLQNRHRRHENFIKELNYLKIMSFVTGAFGSRKGAYVELNKTDLFYIGKLFLLFGPKESLL